jgi:monoamine oxidase
VPDLDIAVVGAGMAGLYATWRLLTSGVKPDRIGLFEASDRIGGRVLTVRPAEDQSLALDMGAHNFSSSHKLVGGLVERFGLKAVPSTGQSPASIVHLRGRSLTKAEIERSYFRKPFAYGVSAYMQRRGPARILRKALEKMPAGPDGHRRLGGRPLAEWTLPDALLAALTPEELRYLADRLIYSFWHRPVQAEAALQWAVQEIFRGKDAMAELAGGMAGLPEAVAKAIAERGGKVGLGHRLEAAEMPDGQPIALGFGTAVGRRTVTAARVILALPPAAIGRLEALAGRPEISALLAALAPQRAVVTALIYREPWWRQIGITGGVSTADLQVRHLRHQEAEPGRKNGAAAAALVSYSDGENADFWNGVADEEARSGRVGPDHPIASEMHRQAQSMFVPRMRRDIPRPIAGFTQDWSDAGGGAAFHMWGPGSEPKTSSSDALRPIDGRQLYICGEAWSTRQGWIEGALETVDSLIARHFSR